jgi:hypothetical protein
MKIPQLRGRAIETTLSHVHPRSFLLPRSQSEYSFMTKYREFPFLAVQHLNVRIFLFYLRILLFTSKSDGYDLPVISVTQGRPTCILHIYKSTNYPSTNFLDNKVPKKGDTTK